MPKKPPKEKGPSRVSSVRSGSKASGVTQVKGIGEVKEVTGIRSVGSVAGTRSASGVRKPTRELTLEEREKVLGLIKDEAEKLFAKSNVSQQQRQVIERAVEIAVDSAIIDENEETDE